MCCFSTSLCAETTASCNPPNSSSKKPVLVFITLSCKKIVESEPIWGCMDTNACNFDENANNCIYLPMIGNNRVSIKREDLTIKDQNICQLILDEKKMWHKTDRQIEKQIGRQTGR